MSQFIRPSTLAADDGRTSMSINEHSEEVRFTVSACLHRAWAFDDCY